MLNLYNTHIESISIHRVGNMQKGEPLFLSNSPHKLSDELNILLKEYFLRPFREKEENYFCFTHEQGFEMNPLYNFCEDIFANPSLIHSYSLKIAQLLYEQGNTPHIKTGEVYVTYLTNLVLDNEKIDAIGIFKSEIKQDFLRFEDAENQLNIYIQQGVNTNKLDKGCIIFNVNREEGYKVMSVDSNKYDTKYWHTNFLGLEALTDDIFYTKKYLNMCKDFAKETIYSIDKDPRQEIMFMNKAVNYFAKNDEFEETEFLNDVLSDGVYKPIIDNENVNENELEKYKTIDLISEFNHFKNHNASKYNIEDVSTFPIANKAVTEINKKLKSTIELDTYMQIKMNFINQESADTYMVKGYDPEKNMYYYKLFFNHEKKS